MLRVRALGGWDVVGGDGLGRTLPAQRVALLALLVVVRDRGVSRDRAAALLWPDVADEKARHSLGQSLYALRRDAASADVVLGTATLRLNADVIACDAWELDAAFSADELARVPSLYAGPFLDGIHVRGSVELDQLIEGERARLADVHARALERLARAASAQGDPRRAAEWWRRLAAVDPLSSRIALELVKSLAAAGDRTAALQAARVHETLVRMELDTDPDPSFATYAIALRQETTAVPRADRAPSAMRSAESANPPSLDGTAAATRELVPNVEPVRHRPGRSRRFISAAIAGTSLLALMLGARRFLQTTEAPDARRVYVAPFENRTGDATLGAFGPMVSGWVSQGLERTGLVAVASASRAEAARALRPPGEPGRDAGAAAREVTALGAGTVVRGAFYRTSGRLRFHVEISSVEWSEVLDAFDAIAGDSADPAEAMDVVRQRTVGSLASLVDPRLSSWARVASKPPSYDAYREFVTGQSIWGSDHAQALDHFLRAAAIDSTYYAARVETAILFRLLGQCARTEAVARALLPVRDRLAPYEYHVLDEQVAQCEGDWERAYREAHAVADLRPGSAFLEYSLALQAMQLGRFGEADALLRRHALEQGVAEVGPNYAVVYAQVLSARGDRTRGIGVARWLRTRYPSYAGAWAIETLLLARAGRVEETERLIDSMVARPISPAAAVVYGLRRVAASLRSEGDTAAARRTLTRALAVLDAEVRSTGPRKQADRGQLLYDAGRFDEALAALAPAADSSDVDVRGSLGLIAARRRDTVAAAAADAWLAAARTPYAFTRTLYRSRIAALLGQRDRSVDLLGKGLDEAGRFLLPAIRDYAEFAAIRSDDRFGRLTALQ